MIGCQLSLYLESLFSLVWFSLNNNFDYTLTLNELFQIIMPFQLN